MQWLVYNRHFAASHSRGAGEQKGYWDKTNKRHTYFEIVISFVCLIPLRLLLSKAVLYHVNG